MRVIAVLDTMNGAVVRGVAGRRDEYRPIQSPLVRDADPLRVASALEDAFGLREFYLADLDAIQGAEPAWDVYEKLLTAGYELWVDAGLSGQQDAARMAEFQVQGRSGTGAATRLSRIIAGLETVPDVCTLGAMLSAVGDARLVFSLDLRQGVPLAGAGWASHDPLEIAERAHDVGVRRFLVLDLARVGVYRGTGTGEICRAIAAFGVDELIAGGGVQNAEDLERLSAAGCTAALVASALHDGRLTRRDVDIRRNKAANR